MSQNKDTLRNRIDNVSFGLNVSIPKGNFASSDLLIDKSGFAGMGLGFRVSSTKTLYKNLGIVISVNANSYSVDHKINDLYWGAVYPIEYLGKWFNFSFNVGADYSVFLENGFLSFRLSPGLFIASRPYITTYPYTIERGKGFSFILMPEIVFVRKIFRKFYFGIFAGLNRTKVNLSYKFQTPRYGPKYVFEFNYLQRITSVDLGIRFHFRR